MSPRRRPISWRSFSTRRLRPVCSCHELGAARWETAYSSFLHCPFVRIMKASAFAPIGSLRNFFRHSLFSLLSPLIVLGLYDYIFRIFYTYDWDQPFVLLICYSALFAGVIY